MSNKDKILTSALKLFNTHDLKSITTNIIAEDCGVSPGNLYYHFKDKEAIIRTLFTQMVEKERCIDEGCSDYSLKGMHKYFQDMLQVYWEFRFLKREIITVISQDPKMKPLVQEYTQMHEASIKDAINTFIKHGILVNLTEQAKTHLTQTTLMQLLFYIPFMEMQSKRITKKVFQEGVDLIFSALEPYLIPQR